MFFFVRCVFWLSVVYSSMPWTVDAARTHPLRDAVVQEGLAAAGTAKEAAIDGAVAWCVTIPQQCLADASRLTALVAAHRFEDLGGPTDTGSAETVPVPQADPRRRSSPKS